MLSRSSLSRSSSSSAPRNASAARPNPLGYLPALDGLRALAVAAVVAYHLGYSRVPGGYIGVELFFVLSGWLVCALLAAEHRAQGGIDLRAFWLRRARRLLPAVTLVVATTLVVALEAGYHQFASLRGDGLAGLGYVLNWRLIVDQQSYFVAAAAGPSPLQHLWSLSIEEQFYLALPLLLGLTLAGRRTARRAALLAFGAAVAATAWRMVVDAPGADPSRLYYGTDTRAAALLVGAALALVWVPERLRPVPGRWAGPLLDAVAVASLAVLGWYTLEVGERDPDAFGWSLTVVQIASLTLIAVVVHPVRGLVARLLGLRPLRWIGQRSYGIYLWHWPLIVLLAKAPGEQPEAPARTAGIVLVTLAVAALSYRLVEQPVRRHGVADSISLARRWTARRIAGRPVLTGAVTALAIVGYVGGVLLARDIVAADDTGGDPPPTVLASSSPASSEGQDRGTDDEVPADRPPVCPTDTPAPADTTPPVDTPTSDAATTAPGPAPPGDAGAPEAVPTGDDGVAEAASTSDAWATEAESDGAATATTPGPADDTGAPEVTNAGEATATTSGAAASGGGAGPTDTGTPTTRGAEASPPDTAGDPGAARTRAAVATTAGPAGAPAAAAGHRGGEPDGADPRCRTGAGAAPAPPAAGGAHADPAVSGAGPAGPVDPAAPAPVPALPWTTAVGDSVMLGAAPALEARFGPQLVLEATIGFQMVDAPELVQRLADEDRLGDVLIVHLGANGPFPDSTLDDIVAIAGSRPVLLVSVKVPRRWEAEVNDRIAAAAERHPGVDVVDWRTVSESEEGLLWRDGHHLTPAGAERFADLLASYAATAERQDAPEPRQRRSPDR